MSGWSAAQRRPFAGKSHRVALARDGSRSDLEEFESDPEIRALDSAVVAPLASQGDLEGVLALYADDSCAAFDDDSLRRVALVTEIIGRFLPLDQEPATLHEFDSRSRSA